MCVKSWKTFYIRLLNIHSIFYRVSGIISYTCETQCLEGLNSFSWFHVNKKYREKINMGCQASKAMGFPLNHVV